VGGALLSPSPLLGLGAADVWKWLEALLFPKARYINVDKWYK
jgi:hypothetical protein